MPETYPYDPDHVVHPGAVLQEWFEDHHLPLIIATKLYGFTPEELGGVLDGSLPITPELARKLLNLTQISTPFWLAMEHNFRVGLAAGKHWTRPEVQP
jgi:plasmid maintenance system antidote protein VapI